MNNFQILLDRAHLNLFLLILVVGIIAVLLFNRYRLFNCNLENFDEKISKTTKTNCGIICTKVIGCSGFLAEDKNNLCYLSQSPIIGEPTDSPFKSEYIKTNERCNKIQSVTDIIIATPNDIKNNATYVCTPNEVDNTQTIKIYDNKEKIISSGLDLPYINVDQYSFENIDWKSSISLNDHKYLVQNIKDNPNIIVMTEYNDEHLGQYMYNHKCSSNVSQKDCLNHCLKSDSCVGTEWNHLYVKKIRNNTTDDDGDGFVDNDDNSSTNYELHRDVCCPKVQIKTIIPRRENFKYGHFYLKELKQTDEHDFGNHILANFGKNK